MSGSGPHFGHKITDELFAALRKLFWHVEEHRIDVSLPCNVTAFITEIPGEAIDVPIRHREPRTFDPLSGAKEEPKVSYVSLIEEAYEGQGGTVEFNPVACHEPVFSEMELVSHGVSFENMAVRNSVKIPIEPLRGITSHKHVAPRFQPQSKTVEAGHFRTAARRHPNDVPRTRTLQTTQFYTMPIKKSPIPPHRFTGRVRQIFREALAEKAKTSPSNIQLRIVFERMDMTLYATMEQDKQGNLLCTPKNEVVGRNALRTFGKTVKPSLPPSYLVFGTRLDTQEDIRALVPVVALEEA